MKFKITHITTYLFDSEVFLEPHYLRFRPSQTSYVNVSELALTILPQPAGHKMVQDEDNNSVDFCWFEGMTSQLTIKAESVLETKPYNPFNFLIYPQNFNTLPFQYNVLQKKLLFSALEVVPISKVLSDYALSILQRSNFNTIPYLTNLTKQLHDDFSVEYRADGAPFIPDETFQLKRGSCRDLSWMLINVLRQQGLAARFVSGYYYFDMVKPAYELHAWVDVYLPGIGWFGLDPSHGILTGNTHFPIASSAHYEHTMPVSGGIRGSASSKLNTELIIEKL
ncbi:transglutaminase domain-containing protein [Cellulophaga algicola DSM 14237]|uniref:Transglutaminase domain-containing protein n=1 Tax=Cellulophaga algicola (strain DSM 14237 / IC166 / ACAM 630) TaxID=688270 RepID=E6XCA8_CELAD|nr:transglutaminase family protein [Cellulophaga algicola]ADV51161.1 transglutaminase domain-containing protein [Cellulophaga algicola DSM 14237]